MNASALETLQNVIVGYLSGVQSLPVIAHRSAGDMGARLDEAMQSQTGVCLIVSLPLPEKVHPHLPGPVFESVSVKVRVVENVLTQRSQLLEVAEHVSRLLHLFNPNLKSWPTRLILNPKTPWKLVSDRNAPMRSVIDLEFLASGNCAS